MNETLIEAIMREAGVKGDPAQVLALIEATGNSDTTDETGAVHDILERFPRLFEKETALPPFKQDPNQGKKKRSRYFPGVGKTNRGTLQEKTGGRKKAEERHGSRIQR